MNTKDIEEIVEEFEKQFVDTEYVIGTNKKAYQEWKYVEDAEEAIDWLRTTLTTLTQHLEAEVEKAVEAERKKCDIRVRKEAEALTKKKIAHGQAMYEKGKKERD